LITGAAPFSSPRNNSDPTQKQVKKNRIAKKVGRGEACHKKEMIYLRGGEERVIVEFTVP